jgi:hypothetical protein
MLSNASTVASRQVMVVMSVTRDALEQPSGARQGVGWCVIRRRLRLRSCSLHPS